MATVYSMISVIIAMIIVVGFLAIISGAMDDWFTEKSWLSIFERKRR